MKRLLGLLTVMLLLGCVSAQEIYFGLSGNMAYAFNIDTETVDTSGYSAAPGAQLGVRNLLGPFGLRATGEYTVYPADGFLEVGADLIFNLGTLLDPYLGLGAGLANSGEDTFGMGRALVGIAPRFSTGFGVFAEASLHAYVSDAAEAYVVKGRGGLNFYF